MSVLPLSFCQKNDLMDRFVVVINEHRKLGLLMLPYVVKKNAESNFYETEDLITEEKFANYKTELDENQKKLCKLIFEYEDQKLTKLFSKKKKTTKLFIDSLPDDLFQKQIRPFIERKISACCRIIQQHNIPLYYKEGTANLYPSDKIEPSLTVSRAKFSFVKDAEGLKYSLSVINEEKQVSMLDKPGFILVNDPCAAVIDNVLYCFDDIDGKKLKPFFLKEFILIPEKFEDKYFETFIYNAIKNYDVDVSGFGYEEVKAEPVPRIVLTTDLKQTPVFYPTFKYGDREVHRETKAGYFVEINKTDAGYNYIKLFRDLEFEAKIKHIYQENGLSPLDSSFYQLKDACTEIDYMSWLSKNKDLLLEHSIEFEIADGKQLCLETPVMDVSVTEEKDWFNVNASLEVNGHKIPFSVVRNYILNKERCFELPDGTLVIIPEEWFAEYKDLALWSKVKGDSVKLKQVHFKALEKSESIDKSALKRMSGFMGLADYEAEKPKGIKAELRSYQHDGFKWLSFMYNNDFGACLADDMGLGKTLQTLSLLQLIKEQNLPDCDTPASGQLSLFDDPQPVAVKSQAWKPSIVVVPASLVFNWMREAEKFAPNLRVLKYVGQDRQQSLSSIKKYDIVLTTYGVLRNDIDQLEKKEFIYAVLDESQIIKNPDSKSFKAVNRLNSSHRLVITGTPIENSLMDLWSQMHFLNADMFGSQQAFKKMYSNQDDLDSLKRIVSPFILRREKQNVLSDLPDLSEQMMYCDMVSEQESLYEEEVSKLRNLYIDAKENGNVKSVSFKILQGLTKLRQLANHPKLFDKESSVDSGKFDQIRRSIESVLAHNHKVLLFSSFVKHLELFQTYCEENSIGYSKLIGDMSSVQRQKEVDKFQNDESKQVFLISLKAGGVGLNLTAADYVFILDPWWNPAAENQAIARAHRMGQQNKVFVYRYISKNTIEEKIKSLQEKKQAIADELISSENKVEFSEELLEELLM